MVSDRPLRFYYAAAYQKKRFGRLQRVRINTTVRTLRDEWYHSVKGRGPNG